MSYCQKMSLNYNYPAIIKNKRILIEKSEKIPISKMTNSINTSTNILYTPCLIKQLSITDFEVNKHYCIVLLY